MMCVSFLAGFCVIFSLGTFCSGTPDLWDHLFVHKRYNKNIRPSNDWTHPTHINFSLSLIAVVEFDEVKETIIITGKLSLSWIDDYLQWDPSNFTNVDHLYVPQSEIWKPYLVLENSVTGEAEVGTPSLQVLVDSAGHVMWQPIQVFHTTCSAKVQKFPFDTQICKMTFEASGYEKRELELDPVNDHIDFHQYGGTTGWTVTETNIVLNEENHAYHLVCSIKMDRNPVYFLLNIFLPISLLSFLNICVFILPVQSGEKASFVVTVFLSLAVFLTIVSGKLPENSETIAFLNIYVFSSTLLSTIIAIVTILQIRIYNRNPTNLVPRYLCRLALLFSPSDNPLICDDESETCEMKSTCTKTKVVPFDPHMRTEEDDSDRENLKTAKEREPVNVSWQRVVKALDNFCFGVFLIINITMTTAVLALATRKESNVFETTEEEHDH